MAIYSPLGHKELDTTEQLTHFPSAQSGKLGIWSKMNFLGHPFFFFFISFLIPFLFIFLFWCVACGILFPWSGIELMPPVVEAQSPNHWTTKELPWVTHFHPMEWGSTKYVWGCGATSTSIYHWWEQVILPLWRLMCDTKKIKSTFMPSSFTSWYTP